MKNGICSHVQQATTLELWAEQSSPPHSSNIKAPVRDMECKCYSSSQPTSPQVGCQINAAGLVEVRTTSNASAEEGKNYHIKGLLRWSFDILNSPGFKFVWLHWTVALIDFFALCAGPFWPHAPQPCCFDEQQNGKWDALLRYIPFPPPFTWFCWEISGR